MLSEREISAAIGSTAYSADGDKLGTVEHFFTDDRTGAPTWVTVMTGLFGTRQSIVPVLDAHVTDGRLQLPVTADAVKRAPRLRGEHLTPDDEATLRRHYDLADSAPPAAPSDGTPADDGAMTRSEEQLRVDTEHVATTRARLVKYVVTEEVQITVPIRREEIRVEQVPVDDPGDSSDDVPGESLVPADEARPDGGGGLPDEIVLHAERPVVTVEVVPVERVRLRTEIVTGQETVTGQVQREQIVVDQDTVRGTPG
jgi:stress response protein YsnF